MTDDTAGAGLDRFGQLKAEIVATHGVEASDPVVNTIAALRLARERMVESLAAGRHVDFTAFTRVLEMLEKHEPAIVPKITVTFVKGTKTRCPHCHKLAELSSEPFPAGVPGADRQTNADPEAEAKARAAAATPAPPKPD